MLNPLWAFISAGLSIFVLIVRTMLEEKTLHIELDGYKEYAASVHDRLLPGVW